MATFRELLNSRMDYRDRIINHLFHIVKRMFQDMGVFLNNIFHSFYMPWMSNPKTQIPLVIPSVNNQEADFTRR